MLHIFHDALQPDAHIQFQGWRNGNEDGFFLNRKSGNKGILHRVYCWHPGGTDRGVDEPRTDSLTRQMKVCSLRVDEIQRWVEDNGVAVRSCSHCNPADVLDELRAVAEESADGVAFEIDGIRDARHRTLATIVQRRGQPVFRNRLLSAYASRYAITDCDIEPVLEAAHIIPYKGEKTNHPANGLLLRTDVHTLFDLGLIAIDPESMAFLVHPSLMSSVYAQYAGKKARTPESEHDRPSPAALEHHREKSGLNPP